MSNIQINSKLKYFFNKIQKYTEQTHYRDNCLIFSMINLYGIETLEILNELILKGENVLLFENIYSSLSKVLGEDVSMLNAIYKSNGKISNIMPLNEFKLKNNCNSFDKFFNRLVDLYSNIIPGHGKLLEIYKTKDKSGNIRNKHVLVIALDKDYNLFWFDPKWSRFSVNKSILTDPWGLNEYKTEDNMKPDMSGYYDTDLNFTEKTLSQYTEYYLSTLDYNSNTCVLNKNKRKIISDKLLDKYIDKKIIKSCKKKCKNQIRLKRKSCKKKCQKNNSISGFLRTNENSDNPTNIEKKLFNNIFFERIDIKLNKKYIKIFESLEVIDFKQFYLEKLYDIKKLKTKELLFKNWDHLELGTSAKDLAFNLKEAFNTIEDGEKGIDTVAEILINFCIRYKRLLKELPKYVKTKTWIKSKPIINGFKIGILPYGPSITKLSKLDWNNPQSKDKMVHILKSYTTDNL